MNELWFFAAMFLDLILVLIAWKLGREWLIATIVMNIILTSTYAAKLIPLFGFDTSVAAIFYASIFIATDILTEHHGKKAGYQSVWIGFLCLFGFMGLGQVVIQLSSIELTSGISKAMEDLFSAIPRIAAASFIAYAIAQRFDIWFFHWIMEKTGKENKLWLRNSGSTIVSQALDSMIFFPLAFLGTMPTSVLISITITGFLFKSMIALIDTPFMYLSYLIKGQRPPGFGWKSDNSPKNLGI